MASDGPSTTSETDDGVLALDPPRRHVTTHDATGRSVFCPALPPTLTMHAVSGMRFADGYAVRELPLVLTDEADLRAFLSLPADTLYFPRAEGATVLRYCDWAPGAGLPMHRTESIDYGTVVFGRMELTLDSGETRTLHAGDSVVQRGTRHAWRNSSDREPARMIFVVQGCRPVRVGGVDLVEHLPWGEGGEEASP
ncbi:hypothetical protein VTK73DRAFT_1422 [Phialemonium thermophilum]|uniref:Cupin type-2 domain-containing protein n=1 Tax=Phialemonium thermophilum TaxID=223376 RepID=A0ABR3VTG3_9PEZI